MQTATAGVDELVDRAKVISRQMAEAANGREQTASAQMPLDLFVTISDVLNRLAMEVEGRKTSPSIETHALTRIANLDIRGATELLELGAWKRISAELQAIALESLGRAKAQANRQGANAPTAVPDEGFRGLKY